jgi:cholestenol delta-isomerase
MSSIAAADTTAPLHPYYPIGIALSGDVFVANDWSASSLVLGFAAGLASILGVAWLVMMKINPRLKASDRALVLWFVSSKCFQYQVFTARTARI